LGKTASATKPSINRQTNPKATSSDVKSCIYPSAEVLISPNSSQNQ
jgi:hypothetical protein